MHGVGQEMRSRIHGREYPVGNPVAPMKTNVGSYDAGVRFVVGCLMLWLGVQYENWWGLAGLAPIATAVCACCPLYLPFHIDTTSTDRPHTHA